MKDIKTKEDIVVLVDAFYQEVRNDELIGPVFSGVIPNSSWPTHLERMYSFWNTVLFGQQDYRGNPFFKHRSLPIEQDHFDRWLALLFAVVDRNFVGVKADEVKFRAGKMATMFMSKLIRIRENPEAILIM